METTKKILLAMDFDHTLIDENSDLWVKKLAPNGELPEHIEAQYSNTGWTQYMASIFEYLHSIGVTERDMKQCLHEIPVTDGMEQLLKYCSDQNYETIIISDSNSVFIDLILANAQLTDLITRVFTNPAYFDESGCLKIEHYHTQDWCDLSTVNLCKGSILQDYVKKRKEEGIQFDSVVYVGDGTNDLCPSLTLKERDFVCPRVDFRLWKKIQKMTSASEADNGHKLYAQVLNWNSGLDILNCLKQFQ